MAHRRGPAKIQGIHQRRRRRGQVSMRPELCSGPAFEIMVSRLSLALGNIDRLEAQRLLLQLGSPRHAA